MKAIRILGKCCVCGLVRVDGRWVRPGQVVEEVARYSHGFCPSCLKRALTDLARAEWCLAAWTGARAPVLADRRPAPVPAPSH